MDSKEIRRILYRVALLSLVLCRTLSGQQLQKGINVRLAATESALPIATADEPNASIITVTADGKTYFRTDAVTPDALAGDLTQRNLEQKLFIKGDASAPYSAVESAFTAARTAGFSDCILLTSQYEMPSGGRILPKGLEVSLKSDVRAKTPRLELVKATEEAPTLKINQRLVPWPSLENTLTAILGSQIDRKVVIKAAGAVPFEQVVHAVDVANSIGAEVVLPSQP